MALAGRQVVRAAGSENRWLALLVGIVTGLGALALAASDRWQGESGDSAIPPETDPTPEPT